MEDSSVLYDFMVSDLIVKKRGKSTPKGVLEYYMDISSPFLEALGLL